MWPLWLSFRVKLTINFIVINSGFVVKYLFIYIFTRNAKFYKLVLARSRYISFVNSFLN